MDLEAVTVEHDKWERRKIRVPVKDFEGWIAGMQSAGWEGLQTSLRPGGMIEIEAMRKLS